MIATRPKTETPKEAFLLDTEIQRRVQAEPNWDSEIRPASVGVAVDKGIVTLTGTVGSYGQKMAAQKVKPEPAKEALIRKSIEHTLERHAAHHCKDVQIETHDGTVTLRGTVRTWREREAVYESVSHTPEVRPVENLLKVNPYI